MISNGRDLSWLLGTRDSVAALESFYGYVWDKILRELALGLGRPGAALRRGLLLRLRALVGKLDPYRDTFVRRWLRDWASAAVVLGEKNAVDGIASQKEASPGDLGAAFGEVDTTKSAASLPYTAGLVDRTAAILAALAAQALVILSSVVTRTGGILLGNAAAGGIVGPMSQRGIERNLEELVLRGRVPAAEKALRALGFPTDLLRNLEGLSEGRIYGEGSGMPTIERSAGNAAGGMISDGHGAGVKIRSAANGVDHVRISNPPRVGDPDVCTVFAGHVFYVGIGTGGKDPLGFPALRDVPGGGPKFHPHCRHGLQPYVVRLKDPAEIAAAREAAKAIPKEYFNVRPYDVTKKVRKQNPSRVNPIARPPRQEERVA